MKKFNRAISIGGESRQIGTPVVTILEVDASENVSRAKGTTVPSDGDRGYAVGCIFTDTDASSGSIVYINEGSATSADFNALVVGEADQSFAGDVTIGDNSSDTLTLNSLTTVTTDQKIQFRDTGIYLQSSSDGVLDIVSDTTVAVSGAVTMDSTLTLTGKLNLGVNGGAASASGLLMGVGTTANPATTSTADDKFIEVRAETTATSGDNRLAYFRYALNGATGGECIRAFTKLTAAGTTVRGAHISLDIDAGSASGLGVGVDSQILLGDAALTGGTYAVANVEAYSAGSSVDVSGVTEFSFLRLSAGGDSTGAANVDDNAFAMTFSGVAAGSGNMIDTDITTHTAYGGLRVNIPGVGTRYIALVSA